MSLVLSIATSGLAAATLRLNVSANNIVNALSFGPLPDANEAAGFPAAYKPMRVDQIDLADGGTVPKIENVLPFHIPVYDPEAPFADSGGMVAMPNVDLANEILQQMIAKYTFAANAKVIGADAKMSNALLNIIA
jgi:flagellar basal-body rod protein FlgC